MPPRGGRLQPRGGGRIIAGEICVLPSCIFYVIGGRVQTPDDEAPASVDFAHPSPIMKYWTLRSTER